MKIKKSILFPVLALFILGGIYVIGKLIKLQGQLDTTQTEKVELTKKVEIYEQLGQVDSLLLEGEYDAAIASYNTDFTVDANSEMGIPFRIEIAKKLLKARPGRYGTANLSDTDGEAKLDLSEAEIRKSDSLNFSLEKTKVQLARLKSQLQNKSFGEYLQFSSKKKNRLHYVGQVKGGKANGYGIALLDTGSRYEGQWLDNQRHGEGDFYWADGEIYRGGFLNDQRNGTGTYFWPNGEKYTGQWKDDKRSGTGKFYDSKGKVIAQGNWDDDKLVDVEKKSSN